MTPRWFFFFYFFVALLNCCAAADDEWPNLSSRSIVNRMTRILFVPSFHIALSHKVYDIYRQKSTATHNFDRKNAESEFFRQ